MKTRLAYSIFIALALTGCQSGYYTEEDYQRVLKIDSHVHVNSDKGFFYTRIGYCMVMISEGTKLTGLK